LGSGRLDSVEHATEAGAALMGGSYRQCVECGKRALSIATRCPGCGRELPAPAVPGGGQDLDLRRFLSPGVVAGVLAAAAVVTVASLGRSSHPSAQESSSIAAIAADSLAADSTAAYSEGAYAAVAPESVGELRVARDWTNVRRSRSTRAELEAVLTPGDTVLADSLERNWYRVALDGEVLGYVHRSTLMQSGVRTAQ
jgi:hypothetical protein